MNSFRELVHEERTNRSLSYRQLADIINESDFATTSAGMINMIEKGTKCGSYRQALAISIALELDLETSLKAIFKDRISHCIDREKAKLFLEIQDAGLYDEIDYRNILDY